MALSVPLDVGAPVFLIGYAIFGLGTLIISVIMITLIESVVLYLFRWDHYRRSLWASFLMNAATSILGTIMVLAGLDEASLELFFFAFLLSVLVEAQILLMMKYRAVRQNWMIAFVANMVSYLFMALPSILKIFR